MSALDEIVARKRRDVEGRKLVSNELHLTRSDRSLEAQLERPGARFIMECKRSSPSKGIIRSGVDPVDVARAYSSVADAISVLCDGPYFGGSLADLQLVREHTHLPVLCKDFVVDPWQVAEARAAGADAILLMLSVLDDQTYRACAREADEWAIDVVTEVHDETEVRRALELGARIIGINNRDLATLDVDLETTRRLAGLVPADRLVVSESGIASRQDVAGLRRYADAFLVGSHLMSQPDIGDAALALAYGRVKVCGLTTVEAALAAERAGARWGGVVFAESPRRVEMDTAGQLAKRTQLPLVGVFVDQPPELMARIAAGVGLVAVQLHGSENAADVAMIRGLLPHIDVWKATHDLSTVGTIPGVDRWLIDAAPMGKQRGGTGRTWDWSALTAPEQVIVAGGIEPENAALAGQLGAYALDVSSGVESAPGVKDPARIAALFDALRGPGRGDA